MLKTELIPSELLAPGERPPVPVAAPARVHRLRGLAISSLFLGWALGLLRLRLAGRLTADERARRLRAVFERLGGLWIKIGQLLSLRTDLFSPELCRELSSLQYQAFGFPPETARRILEEDLGRPLEQVFESFDDQPFAAASIAQIHRARLRREEAWVAVKVRRPEVVGLFDRDMRLIRRVCGLCERLGVAPYFRWNDFVWELEQALLEELDYRFETENLRRMKKTLRRHRIYVPKVFREHTSPRVLVMELVQGALMSDVIRMHGSDPGRLARWLDENRIDPARVGRRLYRSSFRQTMEDNLFHSDLHPGNIVLLRDSRIAFLDFGCIGTLEEEFRQKFCSFTQALAHREYAKAVDYFFLLNHSLPDIDLMTIKEELTRTMRAWERRTRTSGLPYPEKSQSSLTLEMGKVLSEYKVSPEWAFLRVTRATSTLDASLMFLMPDANYSKLMTRCQRQAERRQLERMLRDGGFLLGRLRQEAEADAVSRSILRREGQVFEGSTTKSAHLLAAVSGGLAAVVFAAGAVLAAGLLYQADPPRVSALVGSSLAELLAQVPDLAGPAAAAALLALGYVWVRLRGLRRRLARKDYRSERVRPAV